MDGNLLRPEGTFGMMERSDMRKAIRSIDEFKDSSEGLILAHSYCHTAITFEDYYEEVRWCSRSQKLISHCQSSSAWVHKSGKVINVFHGQHEKFCYDVLGVNEGSFEHNWMKISQGSPMFSRFSNRDMTPGQAIAYANIQTAFPKRD